MAPPSLSPQRMRPMELMHIPAYKPKPVIGGESSAPPQVSRHTRSSSDSVAQVLANVETDRRVSLESFKQQVSLSKFLVDFFVFDQSWLFLLISTPQFGQTAQFAQLASAFFHVLGNMEGGRRVSLESSSSK